MDKKKIKVALLVAVLLVSSLMIFQFPTVQAYGDLIDSYSETNQDTIQQLYGTYPSDFSAFSQSFNVSDACELGVVRLYLNKTGSPTGNVTVAIYNHTGTFGTSSLITGTALGTSDSLDIGDITTSFALYDFNFSSPVSLDAATYYVLMVYGVVTGEYNVNYVAVSTDSSTPSHLGNYARWEEGYWAASDAIDMPFYAYAGEDVIPPTYSDLSYSTTEAGALCYFNATYEDETALAAAGGYIFQTNNTGFWAISGQGSSTENPETVDTPIYLNATVGFVLGYRWNFTDNAGNSNTTGILSFILTDGTVPTYSELSTSTTVAGASCNFNATFNDETALPSSGQYQFATNNTGTWVWESAINFTSTPESVGVTKTLNSTVGQVVGYRWNVTDNVGNLNYTAISTLTLTDGTAPTYNSVSHSTSEGGTTAYFNTTINDNSALETNGQYQFATNNTGTWVWESLANFTSTPETLSISKTLNNTLNQVVGYRWNITDHVGNANYTGIYTLTITDTTVPTYSSQSNSTNEAGAVCYFNLTVGDLVALEEAGQYQFATNNTGVWVWDSAINFTSTPQTISTSKTLNGTDSQVVGFRWNITDNEGNPNSTPIYTLTISDSSVPTLSGVSHSQTGLGGQTIFSATVTDANGLVGGGWIFSQNITGTWANTTYTAFTTNPEAIQSIDTLGLQGNVVVGYRWYLNDTLGNLGSSSIYTLTTDDESLGGGGVGGGDDDTPPPDEDTVPFGGGGVGFDLPKIIEDIAEAIRNMPPWVLWGILAILGAVAVVGISNQQIGKEAKRYVKAPVRKLEQELNPQRKNKKRERPWRSKLKLFD